MLRRALRFDIVSIGSPPIGATKSVRGEVDEITLRPDTDDRGRAALFVRDSADNVTAFSRADAEGSKFTIDDWEKLAFDRSTNSSAQHFRTR